MKSYVLKLDWDIKETKFKSYVKRVRANLNIIGLFRVSAVKVMQTFKGFHIYLTLVCSDDCNDDITLNPERI